MLVDQFFSCTEELDKYESLIASLSGLIVVFDVRLRSFPDGLDNPNFGIVAICLFWSVWHIIHCGICSVGELSDVTVQL